MRRSTRTSTTVLAAVLLLAASACSHDENAAGTVRTTGDCGSGKQQLKLAELIPAKQLSALLPDGAYREVGGFDVDRYGKLRAAYDGDCQLQDHEGQTVLSISFVNAKDPRYVDGQRMLQPEHTAGIDGYKRIDPTTYVVPDDRGPKAAKAVSIQPDRFIVLEILRPATGVSARKKAGPLMVELAKRVEGRS